MSCGGRGIMRGTADWEGRQTWSPIDERGMGAPHDEQVMEGRTTEARSSAGRGARRDIAMDGQHCVRVQLQQKVSHGDGNGGDKRA
jgi:hypothetical protein